MTRAVFPPIKAGFVFPLVVLATKNKGVLVPDQALAPVSRIGVSTN